MWFRETEIFSDSWHWMAPRVVAIHPHVRVRRQRFRGRINYVLEDPLNNRFVRVSPPLYRFLTQLDGERSVGDIWDASLAESPQVTPSQQEVVDFVSRLHASGLLRSDHGLDAQLLAQKKYNEQSQRRRKQWLHFLFVRVPLINPDKFLKRTSALGSFLFGRTMGLVWLAVMAMGVFLAISHASALTADVSSIFDPGNWFALYVTWFLVKLVHEFSHAYACRSRGGQVNNMGVMLLVFTPIPYCDATASWRFRDKYDRMLIGAAGMLAEFFLAAIALLVWAQTNADQLINQLAYNIVFLASVSTLIFNINPLLRFDGYYILSDWLEMPNLQKRSQDQIKYLFESAVLGITSTPHLGFPRKEAAFYFVYGVTSALYRLVIFAGILFFVAERFLGLGLLMATAGSLVFLALPLYKFVRYLCFEPRLQVQRQRIRWLSAGLVTGLILAFFVLPFPRAIKAPAVLMPEQEEILYAVSDAQLVAVPDIAQRIEQNSRFLVMQAPEMVFQIRSLQAQLKEYQATLDWALVNQPGMVAALNASLAATSARIKELESDQHKLALRATSSGHWVAYREKALSQGEWVLEGQALGQIVSEQATFVSVIVTQQQAAELFSQIPDRASVRFSGRAFQPLRFDQVQILSNQQERLPTPSLGWGGGGPVAVDSQDAEGTKTLEPFYEVRLRSSDARDIRGVYRTGWARIPLRSEPAAVQIWRVLRQTFQRRLRL